jgi:predicted HTH transcriptional regulator
VLDKYSLEDLDKETLDAYRNQVKAAKPALAWLELNDKEFLQRLGGWRFDRETERSGLTVGGLLMFGRLPAIQEELPHYMLDYQERPEPRSELRWADRLTSDGTWSGNLYDFFKLVIKKLHSDLKTPFQLSGAVRVEDSPVHQALREALVNTLIHADFTGRVSILVVKTPDLFGFRNPGGMRLTLEDALRGGMSDCRNRVLQRLFRMAGFAEQAGTGIPKIYSSWLKKNWLAPRLTDHREPPEQTILTLPMISLISEETQRNLEKRFGSRFRDLPHTQLVALATVAAEEMVTHARLKSMVTDHPRDITAALAQLCREGFLESAGAARGKYYFFTGEPPESREGQEMLFDPERQERTELSSVQMQESSVQMQESSVQMQESSVPLLASSEHWQALLELGTPIRSRRKASRIDMESTILEVCRDRFLPLKQLGEILGRSGESLRIHYLNAMARDGRIVLRYPEAPNHPSQAYTAHREDA